MNWVAMRRSNAEKLADEQTEIQPRASVNLIGSNIFLPADSVDFRLGGNKDVLQKSSLYTTYNNICCVYTHMSLYMT